MRINSTGVDVVTGQRWAGHVTGHVIRWTSPRPSMATAGGPLVRPLIIDWLALPQPAGAEGPYGGMEGRTAMRWASMNVVIVLTALFSVVTLSTTAALVIFCRKKNSVFAMHQAGQEDSLSSEGGLGQGEAFELRHIGVVVESHPLSALSSAQRTDMTCVTDVSDCEEEDIDDVTTDTPLLPTNRKATLRLTDTRVDECGAVTVCNALLS